MSTPEAPKKVRKPASKGLKIFGIVVVVLLIAAVVAIATTGSGDSAASKAAKAKDASTVALISAASDRLATITSQATSGDTKAAAAEWSKKITAIYPTTDNAEVMVLSNDYVAYANAVRLYVVGQGTLGTVQDAQSRVQNGLLALE